eukprot:640669-Rhodomonas_salina.1
MEIAGTGDASKLQAARFLVDQVGLVLLLLSRVLLRVPGPGMETGDVKMMVVLLNLRRRLMMLMMEDADHTLFCILTLTSLPRPHPDRTLYLTLYILILPRIMGLRERGVESR